MSRDDRGILGLSVEFNRMHLLSENFLHRNCPTGSTMELVSNRSNAEKDLSSANQTHQRHFCGINRERWRLIQALRGLRALLQRVVQNSKVATL